MGAAQAPQPDASSSPPAAAADACVSVSPQDSTAAKQPSACSRCRQLAARVVSWCWDQWFLLGLGVAIAFAAAVPRLGASGGWIQAQYSIKIPAIIVIFLISGIGLKTRVLLQALTGLHIHLLIQALSLGVIPLIGYGVGSSLAGNGFNPWLAHGFVILAAMPTTVSTNVVYTQKAAGNEAIALINAVLGNIIGIFITPAWLGLFLNVEGQAPYSKVLTDLAYQVLAPLAVGQVAQYATPKAVAWVKAHVNTANISSICILLLVWTTFCDTFNNRGTSGGTRAGDVAAMVALCIALFLLFTLLCFLVASPPPPADVVTRKVLGLRRSDAVAVVICGATKTVALGVPLINVMYKGTPYVGLLATPLIIYHALQILLGGVMLPTLKKWCLADPHAVPLPVTAAPAAAPPAAAAGTVGGDGDGVEEGISGNDGGSAEDGKKGVSLEEAAPAAAAAVATPTAAVAAAGGGGGDAGDSTLVTQSLDQQQQQHTQQQQHQMQQRQQHPHQQ